MSKLAHSNQATMDEIEARAHDAAEPDEDSSIGKITSRLSKAIMRDLIGKDLQQNIPLGVQSAPTVLGIRPGRKEGAYESRSSTASASRSGVRGVYVWTGACYGQSFCRVRRKLCPHQFFGARPSEPTFSIQNSSISFTKKRLGAGQPTKESFGCSDNNIRRNGEAQCLIVEGKGQDRRQQRRMPLREWENHQRHPQPPRAFHRLAGQGIPALPVVDLIGCLGGAR